MAEHLQWVNRQPLADQVVAQLRSAIEAGHFTPGQRLVESDLAGRFGVSRAPLREALRELQKEGVVTSAPGHGSTVAAITAAVVDEIYDLRQAVESLAVRRCTQQAHSLNFSALEQLIADLEADRPAVSLIRSDLDFHEGLCAMSGYPRVLAAFSGLRCITGLAMSQFGVNAHNPLLVVQQHRALLQAVAGAETETALRLLHQHLTQGKADLLAVLGQSGGVRASDTTD